MKIKGLVAAVATPMKRNGAVNLSVIDDYAHFLIGRGIDGVFVCGTTGEGVLLDEKERKAVLERWMPYADRIKILAHVGAASYRTAGALAAHAESVGVCAISAMGPCFLQPSRAEELVAFNKEVAACAPHTPYYYYNIPGASGVHVNMVNFLRLADGRIPTLNGIKYTDFDTCQMLECIRFAGGRYDILHGHDETLLAGLQIGATGGIGTSFNVTSPIFRRLLDAFARGDQAAALEAQWEGNRWVDVMNRYVSCLPGIKAMLTVYGIPVGPCRLPVRNLTRAQFAAIERAMKELGA